MEKIFGDREIKKEQVTIYSNITEEEVSEILGFINNSKISDLYYHPTFKFIDSGAFGRVFKYKNYAVKLFFDISDDFELNTDACNLLYLKDIDLYPQIYAKSNYFMISEFIEGKTLFNIEEDSEYECLQDNAYDLLLEGIRKTIEIGIEPSDLNRRNIMLTKDGYFKIVDVGNYCGCRKNLFREIIAYSNNDEIECKINNCIENNYLWHIDEYLYKIKNCLENRKLQLTA